MNDWNNNGKYDMQDSYLDYGMANSDSSGSSSSSNWWVWVLLAVIVAVCPPISVFILIGIFIFGR